MENRTIIPPQILQYYNSALLSTPYRVTPETFKSRLPKIVLKACMKYNLKCPGKKKEFNKLLSEFLEVYERKKIEDEEYQAKKQDQEKRSSLSATGNTIIFKRMEAR